MTLLNKVLLILLGLTVMFALVFVAYKSNQIANQQNEINKSIVEFKQLQDGIVRAQSQYATKQDIESFAKQNNVNLASIKDDLSALNATLTGINQARVITSGSKQTNIASTTTTPNPNPTVLTATCDGKQIPCADAFGYQSNQQHLVLGENFPTTQVPFGDVGFSAWQQNPWNATVYPRSYNMTNVLGTDEDGRHYVYNKFSIDVNGKNYPVQIADSKFVEEYPSPSLSLFNPRLFGGADGTIGVSHLPITGEFTPNVSVGIASYGKTKTNPDFSLVQLGVGYGTVSRNVQIVVSPAQYNIGQHMPLMKNTYIGPSVDIGTNGNVFVGLGMRVGL